MYMYMYIYVYIYIYIMLCDLYRHVSSDVIAKSGPSSLAGQVLLYAPLERVRCFDSDELPGRRNSGNSGHQAVSTQWIL